MTVECERNKLIGGGVTTLFGEIRNRILEGVAECLPELRVQVRKRLTDHPLPPVLLLSPASCAATGGDPRSAVSIAAAIGMLILAIRWFDDIHDRDRPGALWEEVGADRATNLAAAALTRAWWLLASDDGVPRRVLMNFGEATATIAAGQDRDLCGAMRTAEDYWSMVSSKTAAGFAFAAAAGAHVARATLESVETLGRYGEHIGVLLQLLDDLEGACRPVGQGDLALGKVTLPIIYGLSLHSVVGEELRDIVDSRQLPHAQDRTREILEEIDAPGFVVWAALAEREQALEVLECLGSPATEMQAEGRRVLTVLAGSGLSDLEVLTGGPVSECPTNKNNCTSEQAR